MEVTIFIGVAGSGKDYQAKKQCERQLAFADALRDDVWKMLGWKPKNDDEYREFKETVFKLPSGEFTGRDIMDNYGTKIRRAEDGGYWIKRTLKEVSNYRKWGCKTLGITDARFPNEIAELIWFCEMNDIFYNIVHCDYKSESYNPNLKGEMHDFVRQFAGKVYEEGEFFDLVSNLALHHE